MRVSRAVSKRSRPFSRAGGHVAVLALDNRARRTYSELLRRTLQEIRLFGGCEVQIRNPRIPNPENHFLLSKLGMPWGALPSGPFPLRLRLGRNANYTRTEIRAVVFNRRQS